MIRLILIVCALAYFNCHAQTVLFYNVENYFDCENDSLVNDDEFTPDGIRHWTKSRQWAKRDKIAKAILASGGWSSPSLVGLCEIENKTVLDDLVSNSPLRKLEYRTIHRESPDHRGIDVALLYQKDDFTPIETCWMPLRTKDGAVKRSREILYCKGVFLRKDTVHLFVNHWPSRYGGQMRSEPARILAAKTVRQKVDSILNNQADALVLIMGDFNDYPHNKSITEHLCKDDLVNLAANHDTNELGSHKYQGKWGMLDQMIVSAALSKRVTKDELSIVDAKFLLETDKRFIGQKPFRTFVGPKYYGGFSDHLPLILKWSR